MTVKMYIHERNLCYLLTNIEEISTLRLSDGNVNVLQKTPITLLKKSIVSLFY